MKQSWMALLVFISTIECVAVEISWKDSQTSSHLVADGALFFLRAVSSGKVEVQNDALELSENDFPPDLWKALEACKTSAQVYSLMKKEAFARLYSENSRKAFHVKAAIPETLKELEALYAFQDKASGWTRSVVKKSNVKAHKRVLYRAPASVGEISIAQTVYEPTEEGVHQVRETEVIARREGEDEWDFYAYDEKGTLATTSTFATKKGKDLVAPVPVTCLTCHYDAKDRLFTNEPSSGR